MKNKLLLTLVKLQTFIILFLKSLNKSKKTGITVLPITYPNIGFGNYVQPKTQTILVKNSGLHDSDSDSKSNLIEINLKMKDTCAVISQAKFIALVL